MAKTDRAYRSQLLEKIAATIRPNGKMTRAQVQATVEALCGAAASAYAATDPAFHSFDVDRATSAALRGLGDYFTSLKHKN